MLQTLNDVISHPKQQNGLLFHFSQDNQQVQLTLCEYDRNESTDADAYDICEIGFNGSIIDIWCQWPLQSLGIKVLDTQSMISFVVCFDAFNKCIQSLSESPITFSLRSIGPSNHAQITLSCSILSSTDNANIEQHIYAHLLDKGRLPISEPSIPCPQIHVRFRSLQRLKSIVHGLLVFSSSFKAKGSFKKAEELFITGTVHRSSGSDEHGILCSLNFKLVHINVKLNMSTTIWSGQEMQYILPDGDAADLHGIIQSTIRISLRDLHHSLQCDSLSPESIVLGLSDRYALVFYVNWPPAMLTFLIPSRVIE